MRRPALLLHQIIPASRSNGPGLRCVIWVQGCRLGCPGCFNPETHSFEGGSLIGIEELSAQFLSLGSGIEGLTISGGEPFHQAAALAHLVERIKARSTLSIIAFTGYTLEELHGIRQAGRVLAGLDVLIAGRFEQSKRVAAGLAGSSNKQFHFLTGRYSRRDFDPIPEAEVLILPDGSVQLTGIDPILW